MPYTPPAPQSPATSLPTSPSISRSQSYTHNFGIPQSRGQARPDLPRSISSTQYIQRHRRSPSYPQSNGNATQSGCSSQTATDQGKTGASISGSLRQSPPPVSNSLIPPGAVMSPPESPQDGSDDEIHSRGRTARVSELRDVIRDTIQLRRSQSPTRAEQEESHNRQPSKTVTSHDDDDSSEAGSGALSPEARRILHSRSATDSAIMNSHGSPMASYSSGQSSDDSDSDEELSVKPPMVRKKSGELVRPALRPQSRRRPSSMPGTPTYQKAVHFNEDIEQVRHFLKVDRPIAVSAGSSPVEAFDSESEYPFGPEDGEANQNVPEWEIRLTNFPGETPERKSMPIRVEKIFLSEDQKSLIGSVAVANISFHKCVVARFTLDYWKTTSEVTAEYDNDTRKEQLDDGYDRFSFNIRLADQANLESKTMFICVRYNVNGQEFWDNNNFTNFQIDFIKKSKQQAPKQSPLGARPIEAIPRSRHSPPASAGAMKRTSIDDNFEAFKGNRSISSSWADDSPSSSVRLKKSSGRKGSVFPGERNSNSTQAFGNRYDFSKSLTTALTHAQSAMGSRTGDEEEDEGGYFAQKAKKSVAPIWTRAPVKTRGPAMTSPPALRDAEVRPSLDSEEYKQMLNQMCFFASGTKAPAPTPASATSAKPPQVDGAHDEGLSPVSAGEHSPSHSASISADAKVRSSVHSPHISRSSSPVPVTGGGLGSCTASPVSFGYPYHQTDRLSESQMPPAVRG